MPVSFESLVFRYSFSSFDAAGIAFFGWGSDSIELQEAILPKRDSLSELLMAAGYLQIGRPDTGNFDAVCFDITLPKQNREFGIVIADHEDILCNHKVKIRAELWPSFRKLLENLPSIGRKSR